MQLQAMVKRWHWEILQLQMASTRSQLVIRLKQVGKGLRWGEMQLLPVR
ncbi:hypothetical protein B7L10_037845 [Burkholderia cenocepacia]|nr:hypothetical protein [Burkholderia cenocepacia]MCW5171104.1 hypothetical protein [Burkholderia cenocepacia]